MQPPTSLKRPARVEEFQSFVMRGNVVDLAVGIIIGAAFTAAAFTAAAFTVIVGSLVRDLRAAEQLA